MKSFHNYLNNLVKFDIYVLILFMVMNMYIFMYVMVKVKVNLIIKVIRMYYVIHVHNTDFM